MTRNNLLSAYTRPTTTSRPSVWRMTMGVLGQAFGARPETRR